MELSMVSENKEAVKALILCQQNFPKIIKNREVSGSFSYEYADLASIEEKVKPILNANGFALIQTAQDSYMKTVLLHVSGGIIESSVPMAIVEGGKNPAQDMGKCITYSRRYSLCVALGIVADDDDDANGIDDQTKTGDDSKASAKAKYASPISPKSREQAKIDDQIRLDKNYILKTLEILKEDDGVDITDYNKIREEAKAAHDNRTTNPQGSKDKLEKLAFEVETMWLEYING
jgi:hypothetical protein